MALARRAADFPDPPVCHPVLPAPSFPTVHSPYSIVRCPQPIAQRHLRCPAPILTQSWRPCDLKNIANPLRGSSFSSISPFPLLNRLLAKKKLQKEGSETPTASPESPKKLPATSPSAAGVSPGGLWSTPRAPSDRPTRPKELRQAQNDPLGVLSEASGSHFRASEAYLYRFQHIFFVPQK